MCTIDMDFDKDGFEEIKSGIFFYPREDRGFDRNTTIYRYVNVEYFLPILNNELFVPARRMFSDLHEHGKHYNPFCYRMMPVGDNPERYRRIFSREQAKRENSRWWLTLCFTMSSPDNYFFWRTYTTDGYGVCYRTTVGQLLDSIKCDDYEIYVGKIKYCDREYSGHNINEYAFYKTKAYEDENELRFYFKPKNGVIKQSETFEIDAQSMISEIILSPFLDPNVRQDVMKLFKGYYSDYAQRISQSKIIETL